MKEKARWCERKTTREKRGEKKAYVRYRVLAHEYGEG